MWIARDEDDSLWVFKNKPIKRDNLGDWITEDPREEILELKDDGFYFFPDIKWEDKEPTELILNK